MNKRDKFLLLLKRYRTYIEDISFSYMDDLITSRVMLNAYTKHTEIPFEEFIRNCVKNPVEYLYQLSETLFTDTYDLHLLNNCFNDGGFGHYGVKVDGT